jgi:hypothetical protein
MGQEFFMGEPLSCLGQRLTSQPQPWSRTMKRYQGFLERKSRGIGWIKALKNIL